MCQFWAKLIDENAFAYCYSLQSIVIPGCVEEVGEYAFHTCLKLDSVTISEGVKILNNRAFDSCVSLKEISIPSSVVEIGEECYIDDTGKWKTTWTAFDGCTSLEKIEVDPNNPKFCSENSFLLNKEKTEVIAVAVAAPDANFVIPDTVRVVRWGVFDYVPSCTITSPAGLEELEIGHYFNVSGSVNVVVKNPYTRLRLVNYDKKRTYYVSSYAGSPVEKYTNNAGYPFTPFKESIDTYNSKYQVIAKTGDVFFKGVSLFRRPIASFTIDTDATELLGVAVNGVTFYYKSDHLYIYDGLTTAAIQDDPDYLVTQENGKMVITFSRNGYLVGQLVEASQGKNEIVFLLPDGAASIPFDLVNLQNNYKILDDGILGYRDWYYGSKSDMTLTTSAANDRVKAVYFNNSRLATTNYTVSEDQCTISIHADYMQNLPYGRHTIVILYENGDASESNVFVDFDPEQGYPEVLEGWKTYWPRNSGKDVTIRIDAPVEEFQGLYVGNFGPDSEDGAGFLKPDLYRVEGGPDQTTVITFPGDSLNRYFNHSSFIIYDMFTAVYSDCSTYFFIIPCYEIQEGESITWDESQGGDVTLHIEAENDSVVYIKMDYRTLGKEYYTIDQSGTVITFSGEYLSTLSAGTHEVEIEFLNGTAHVTLTIVKHTADLTGDGEMDTRDATRLVQHLSNWDAELMGSADFNNDGAVDTRDATRLIQYLSGWEVKLY